MVKEVGGHFNSQLLCVSQMAPVCVFSDNAQGELLTGLDVPALDSNDSC